MWPPMQSDSECLVGRLDPKVEDLYVVLSQDLRQASELKSESVNAIQVLIQRWKTYSGTFIGSAT